jgi:phosphatidylserine/phosphatidylglycerophosphate/cardiolipin synthase-like enzyme
MEIIASTNSLAATDHFFTYAITMKQKKYLLQKVGMQIFEFKPVPGDVREMITRYDELVMEINGQDGEDVVDDRIPTTAEGPITGLHAKSIVIDDRVAYVGSHNFDPRSIGHDTQLGILIWDVDVALALKADILRDTEAQNSWVTAAKHEGIPLVSFFGGILEDISRAMPIFDVWPFKYSTSWDLREGEEPVPPGHPEFYERYKNVGQFPTVNMSTKDVQTRLFKVMGGFTEPLM